MRIFIPDLQPFAWWDRRARRGTRGTPHHRDQLTERRGRTARTNRQSARHLCRRGNPIFLTSLSPYRAADNRNQVLGDATCTVCLVS